MFVCTFAREDLDKFLLSEIEPIETSLNFDDEMFEKLLSNF